MNQSEIKYPICVEVVNSLSVFEKLRIYIDYYSTQVKMKHDFHFVDKSQPDWQHGMGKPDNEKLGLAYYNLWRDLPIYEFDDFVATSNVKVTDCGASWDKQGFASRYIVNLQGIYNWYSVMDMKRNKPIEVNKAQAITSGFADIQNIEHSKIVLDSPKYSSVLSSIGGKDNLDKYKPFYVKLFGYYILSVMIWGNTGWFRLFSKGLQWKQKDAEMLFSERSGKTKSIVIGNWRIKYLP